MDTTLFLAIASIILMIVANLLPCLRFPRLIIFLLVLSAISSFCSASLVKNTNVFFSMNILLVALGGISAIAAIEVSYSMCYLRKRIESVNDYLAVRLKYYISSIVYYVSIISLIVLHNDLHSSIYEVIVGLEVSVKLVGISFIIFILSNIFGGKRLNFAIALRSVSRTMSKLFLYLNVIAIIIFVIALCIATHHDRNVMLVMIFLLLCTRVLKHYLVDLRYKNYTLTRRRHLQAALNILITAIFGSVIIALCILS